MPLTAIVRTLVAILAVSSVIRVAHADPAPGTDEADAAMYACSKPKGDITVSFKPELELKELAAWAMGVSCRKIVYSSTLATRATKVTMLTPGAMKFSEAWELFHTALRTMGLSVVKKGQTLEIVESASAKEAALDIMQRFPDGGGDTVRLLLRPEHVGVDDLKTALELVKSKAGDVSPLPKLNALLITDDAAHVARMQTLVDELDKPAAGDGVFAIPVEHLDPATMVETLTKLIGDGSAAGAGAAGNKDGAGAGTDAPPKLVAAPRVNAVFVVGSSAAYLRVRAIAKALDLDVGDTARIQSFKLRNASAKDVAATLSSLVSSAGSQNSIPSARGDTNTGDTTVTGPIHFAADDASNTLLVMASARDAAAIHTLIDDLDQAQRQVYIEALVLEVEASNTREVGVSAHGGDPWNGSAIVGSFQSPGLSTVDLKSSLGQTGVIGGVLGKPLTGILGDLIGTDVPSFGVLLRLAAHESRLDVLSSPHLMVMDNKEGVISVGDNIPVKASGSVNTGTFQTNPNIERAHVDLKLTITPHVSRAAPGEIGDMVRLDIALESNVLGKEDFGGLGPSWGERSITTTVALRDQDSLVLGGMTDERIEDTVDKIPVLGDIPLLGYLFRSSKKVRTKKNLLVVLTPHLIDDSVAGRAILERRMREREEFMTSAIDLAERALQPDIDYRTKRGLVAEIDATVAQIEADKAALDAIKLVQPPDGRIDTDAAAH